MSASFSGIWPALLTPLNADLSINRAAFGAHAKRLITMGAGGVTPFGTTGEGASFTVKERREGVEALIAGGVAAERILVSTSCAALPDVVELTRHAVSIGAHGVLMLPPFFMKGVSDQGIVDSYSQVLDAVREPRLRVYLYHIPQVSGVPLSHAVIRALKDRYPDQIVGIKDSGCDFAWSKPLAEAFMPGITVYVGNEPDLPALGRMGSTGAVSGLANFMPRMVRRLVLEPDAPGTAQDLSRTKELLRILGGYSLIPSLKAIQAMRDGDMGWLRVRAPLVAMSEAEARRLDGELRGVALDPAAD